MGFMGTGKSAEDKALEKLATYLENMDLRPKDGMVHAGAFEMAGGYSRKNTSRILNGVLEFMQKQGYEILDVQLSPSGMGDSLLCCLVLITYKKRCLVLPVFAAARLANAGVRQRPGGKFLSVRGVDFSRTIAFDSA